MESPSKAYLEKAERLLRSLVSNFGESVTVHRCKPADSVDCRYDSVAVSAAGDAQDVLVRTYLEEGQYVWITAAEKYMGGDKGVSSRHRIPFGAGWDILNMLEETVKKIFALEKEMAKKKADKK